MAIYTGSVEKTESLTSDLLGIAKALSGVKQESFKANKRIMEAQVKSAYNEINSTISAGNLGGADVKSSGYFGNLAQGTQSIAQDKINKLKESYPEGSEFGDVISQQTAKMQSSVDGASANWLTKEKNFKVKEGTDSSNAYIDNNIRVMSADDLAGKAADDKETLGRDPQETVGVAYTSLSKSIQSEITANGDVYKQKVIRNGVIEDKLVVEAMNEIAGGQLVKVSIDSKTGKKVYDFPKDVGAIDQNKVIQSLANFENGLKGSVRQSNLEYKLAIDDLKKMNAQKEKGISQEPKETQKRVDIISHNLSTNTALSDGDRKSGIVELSNLQFQINASTAVGGIVENGAMTPKALVNENLIVLDGRGVEREVTKDQKKSIFLINSNASVGKLQAGNLTPAGRNIEYEKISGYASANVLPAAIASGNAMLNGDPRSTASMDDIKTTLGYTNYMMQVGNTDYANKLGVSANSLGQVNRMIDTWEQTPEDKRESEQIMIGKVKSILSTNKNVLDVASKREAITLSISKNYDEFTERIQDAEGVLGVFSQDIELSSASQSYLMNDIGSIVSSSGYTLDQFETYLNGGEFEGEGGKSSETLHSLIRDSFTTKTWFSDDALAIRTTSAGEIDGDTYDDLEDATKNIAKVALENQGIKVDKLTDKNVKFRTRFVPPNDRTNSEDETMVDIMYNGEVVASMMSTEIANNVVSEDDMEENGWTYSVDSAGVARVVKKE